MTQIRYEIGKEGGADRLKEVPDLFPDAHRYNDPIKLRKYIEDVLIQLAKNDELSVTELLNQDLLLWEIAGKIILGQTEGPTPKELSNYWIKIRSLSGNSFKWKVGLVPYETIKSRQGRASGDGKKETRVKERWAISDSSEIELPLPDAWLCLRQIGKYCNKRKTKESQARYWKVEEARDILPDTKKNKKTKAA